jgi:hypothetical protein
MTSVKNDERAKSGKSPIVGCYLAIRGSGLLTLEAVERATAIGENRVAPLTSVSSFQVFHLLIVHSCRFGTKITRCRWFVLAETTSDRSCHEKVVYELDLCHESNTWSDRRHDFYEIPKSLF